MMQRQARRNLPAPDMSEIVTTWAARALWRPLSNYVTLQHSLASSISTQFVSEHIAVCSQQSGAASPDFVCEERIGRGGKHDDPSEEEGECAEE